ncbi:MAG: hypothetical protein ACQETQ_00390 [Spirochaetota bacterium]
MRKFLISLVIVILAGGTAFYFGWVQLQLPPNTYGVVFTKTGGWDETVLEPGEFHWRWERLLPTNFTLHVFPATPHDSVVTSSGTLPSGDVYAEYLDQRPDFGYEIEVDLAFRVRKEDLPQLAAEEDLEPEGLEEWYERQDSRIRDASRSMVRELYADAHDQSEGSVQLESLEDELIDRLSERFSSLQFLSAVPNAVKIPDLGLYETARSLYFETIEARREAIAESEFDAEEERISQASRLETLKQYGQVLSDFPVLLDYFSLSAEEGFDPLELDAVRNLGAEEPQQEQEQQP